MPRAIWSGAISFGLVNIPVKLYSAVQRKTVRFNQLDGSDNSRVRQKRINENTGEEVPYENLVKGYEIGPDRYVVITPDELESVQPEKSRTIDIEDFVELDQIDPMYFDHTYYLAPGAGAGKAYSLLLKAMEETGRVAIARVVIRSKENLVAIRPRDGVLAMETMLFSDEVVEPEALEDLPDGTEKTNKREVEMAQQLIESLASDFQPGKYRDEYRDRVLEMNERKAEGEEITIEAPAEEPQAVPDLMAALEASFASSKRQSGGEGKRQSGGDGKRSSSSSSKAKGKSRNGSGSSRSKKKTAAKK